MTAVHRKGSKVFSIWNGNVYKARILDIIHIDPKSEPCCKIHYNKFSKKWDEIVTASKLFEKRMDAVNFLGESLVIFILIDYMYIEHTNAPYIQYRPTVL